MHVLFVHQNYPARGRKRGREEEKGVGGRKRGREEEKGVGSLFDSFGATR
jgi:hypothetical protein